MSKRPNMLSSVAPWDAVADGYADVTMKLFQVYTDHALRLADIGQHSRVLDVCCGPGTTSLTLAKYAHSVDALDFSSNMLALLRQHMALLGLENIEPHCGDGQQLPYRDNHFDAAFSLFGLMFFPDRARGYAEIYRTLKPGGCTVISSWAPVVESSAMMAVFGALKAMNPELPEPQTDIESLENPGVLKSELEQAGFNNVQIHRVRGEVEVTSVEDFWEQMVKGSAPIVMLKNSLREEQWRQKNQIALDYLYQTFGDEPRRLNSDAWLGFGRK